MSKAKVTRDYQITIPADIRERTKIERGDVLVVHYNEDEDIIEIRVPKKDDRKTRKLSKNLRLQDIESSVERGMKNRVRP